MLFIIGFDEFVMFSEPRRKYFGRIIFHTEDVDKLYFYLKKNQDISTAMLIEDEPRNAPWGERYFHIREPDGYQLSFAELSKKRTTRA